MKIFTFAFKPCLCYAIFYLALTTVDAQKLPKVQTESVYAPTNIKIDGKPDEWNNSFQAYNPNDHYFYTISNDDNNLYIIIYTDDHICAERIGYGGITLNIDKLDGKKSEVEVTYPIGVYKTGNIIGGYLRIFWDKVAYPNQSPKHLTAIRDSINKKITNEYKEISVKGINEINEPSISVYNENGIKANLSFDDKKVALTYELAISRKYLTSINNFKYTIILNGRTIPMGPHGGYNGSVTPPTGELDSPSSLHGQYVMRTK